MAKRSDRGSGKAGQSLGQASSEARVGDKHQTPRMTIKASGGLRSDLRKQAGYKTAVVTV